MLCDKDCGCTGRELNNKRETEYERDLPGWFYLGLGVAIGAMIYVAMLCVGLFSKLP